MNSRSLSLVLKYTVVVSAIVGVILSAIAGADAFMGGTRVFMYFTIQSNIAIALICAIGSVLLVRKQPIKSVWYLVHFIGTVSITLTGVVFCFVLAPTMGVYAWSLPNILTHVVVPLAAVADFFLSAIHGTIRKSSSFYVILPPIAYAFYAGIGYVAGWEFSQGINYPYFFLNWGSPAGAFGFTDELPFMGCGWWILLILVMLLIVGYLYLLIIDLIRKRSTRRDGPFVLTDEQMTRYNNDGGDEYGANGQSKK
ncbi:MAG: Pr6Pr family membrane protein [Oscillospiraceae bacterium]|nr:Pr6Pr family membrane protein [Oscillospiraceae bacterium]